jgi:serine phosphatase RsbU (regulator of sigma subunit)
VSKGEIREYFPLTSATKDTETSNPEFTSEIIHLLRGDTIYLCSDGYSDQFGGPLHKKYQRSRFKSLLLSIQSLTMPEQSDMLYEEIEKWREENDEDQTDDILVIGIRI